MDWPNKLHAIMVRLNLAVQHFCTPACYEGETELGGIPSLHTCMLWRWDWIGWYTISAHLHAMKVRLNWVVYHLCTPACYEGKTEFGGIPSLHTCMLWRWDWIWWYNISALLHAMKVRLNWVVNNLYTPAWYEGETEYCGIPSLHTCMLWRWDWIWWYTITAHLHAMKVRLNLVVYHLCTTACYEGETELGGIPSLHNCMPWRWDWIWWYTITAHLHAMQVRLNLVVYHLCTPACYEGETEFGGIPSLHTCMLWRWDWIWWYNISAHPIDLHITKLQRPTYLLLLDSTILFVLLHFGKTVT